MTQRKDKIALFPLGPVAPELLTRVAEALKEAFDKEVDFLRPIDMPEQAFNPTRKQYHSSTILRIINRMMGDRYERVLGVTAVDLFVPQLNYVTGEPDVLNGNAIVSTARLRPEFYGLRPDPELFLSRLLKEAVHEIGHSYNMTHCENADCVMYFSNSIQDTDGKSKNFCKDCKKMLVDHLAPAVS